MWNNSSRRSFNHSKFTGLITHSFYIEMQSRCIQVVFVISSLILFKAQHVIGSGLSCLRSSSAAHRQKRITFLREDADGVRSLYTSLWSDDTRPVICEVNTDPIVTDRYCRICERTGTQGQEITQRFNISMLLSPNSPCALVSSSSVPKFTKRTRRAGIEGKVRRKRAWIFPGTLWCGTGSKAAGYEQLGMFESADRCCREHDHCLHVILAFTVNYGVFNSNLFTVSLCDCDQRFRQCLLGVNDTISSMVGYSFFNILQVPCFELKQQKQCTEMNWWGTCKVTKKAPYAVFKSPLPFSAVTSNNGDNTDSNMVARSKGKHVTESFVINPHKKSPKGERRCNSRDRLKGDTFYLRRTEGKGCKKHRKLNTTTPSQLPPMSIVYTTSPSIKKGILNASKSTVMMPIKKRTGKKKSNMNGLSDYVTQRQNSYPQTTSARQSSPSLTQKPALQLHLSTTITAVTKSHKEVPKQSRCCGFKMPLRGDTFQPHCKSCLEQKKTLSVTPVTPSTITYGLPVKMATDMTLRLKQTTETPKQDTLQRLWSAATSATAVITKPDIATSIHKKGKPQKQRKSLLRQNNTRQEHMGSTTALSTGAGRDLMQNISLNNMTENQLLCGSLILLDECKYNILPLEKKYDLQNRESKTAYHCDCTSRLAVQIGSFKQPSILPKLLMDFVSQYCFKLPNERKCHRRKSCSGGFSKASDLLQALSVMEEKDTAGVQNAGNGRRRGIPTRLYKRCLRQVREADVLAQLTRF